jgi:hypothetical protein
VDETNDGNFHSKVKGMSDGSEWTLEKIRKAYGEVLWAWNELFPLHPQKRSDQEEPMESVDYGDIEFLETFRRKGKEIGGKLKKAADQSGNPVVWHRGDPLDSLTPGMKGRIKRALEFGT